MFDFTTDQKFLYIEEELIAILHERVQWKLPKNKSTPH
jgi:hypothetical protein